MISAAVKELKVQATTRPMLEITLEEALEMVEAARESGTILQEIRTAGLSYVYIEDAQGKRFVTVNETYAVGSMVMTIH